LGGLQHLIKQYEPALQIAGSATSCQNATDLLPGTSADVILLDLDFDAEQALENILHFLEKFTAKILVLSRMENQVLLDKAILAGACGIIDAKASADILPAAITKVHEGQMWLDRATTNRIFVKLSRNHVNHTDQQQNGIESLTRSERKVIAQLANNAGAPGKLIATKLGISESTLRNHLSSIYSKLDVINRHGLIAYAQQYRQQLLSTENS
jgi:DNA-binding NarL/FixJ family response regulator